MKYGLKTREKIVLFLSLLICPLFTCQIRALALEDDQVKYYRVIRDFFMKMELWLVPFGLLVGASQKGLQL